MKTRIAVAACAVLLALVITACGEEETAKPPSASAEPTSSTTGSTGATPGEFRREPTPIQLYQSTTSGNRVIKPAAVAIQNEAALDKWIEGEFSRDPGSRIQIASNFDQNRQVWAAFIPESPRGTRIAITGAATDGVTSRLYVTVLLPEKDCPPSQAPASFPSAYVETRKMPARAKVKITRIREGC